MPPRLEVPRGRIELDDGRSIDGECSAVSIDNRGFTLSYDFPTFTGRAVWAYWGGRRMRIELTMYGSLGSVVTVTFRTEVKEYA